MIFGGSPTAGMTVGVEIRFAIVGNYSQKRSSAIDFFSTRELNSPNKIDST